MADTVTKYTAKNAPEFLNRLERDRVVLQMRLSGATYSQIKESTGLSISMIHKILQRHVKKVIDKMTLDTKALVKLEEERLDMALLSLAPKVRAGHLGAIDRWVKVSESRRKLLGLDAQASEAPPLEVVVRIERTASGGDGDSGES